MAYLEYFNQDLIQLNKEITQHPELQKQLTELEDKSFEAKLAVICTFCEIIIDGYYDQKEIENLARILVGRLQQKRIVLILPPSNISVH